ncbi:hypothetical protein BH09MYX1_BH09MYX1_11930 [soil metagenome]
MLTSDLVPVRRRGAEIHLVAIDDKKRARALAIAEMLVDIAATHVGEPRGELEDALATVPAEARDEKLRAGLAKLVLDRCAFEAEAKRAPDEVRDALFRRATEWRRAGSIEHSDAIVEEVGRSLDMTAMEVESSLYADLKSAHPLRAFAPISPSNLVTDYVEALPQAVLLRAARIAVDVRPANPASLRALLRKLKFLRLLFALAPAEDGHRLIVEGPLSMFDGGARYGLKLAMLLPALRACGAFDLAAEVRWGKEHALCTFRVRSTESPTAFEDSPLPDEVQALLDAVNAQGEGWRATRAETIVDLPGLGVVVPDLLLTKKKKKVFVEVLGFWSREAVWRRVELAEAGLREKMIFVASERLRVSEEVLASEHACLYVYKGVIGARGLLERAERLIK